MAVFGGKVLEGATRLSHRRELVDNGILRKGFAGYLWGVEGGDELLHSTLQQLLVTLGVAVPIPDSTERWEVKPERRSQPRCCDLLIPMRLPGVPTTSMRHVLQDLLSKSLGLKAVWAFHDGGAPYGLPERVIAQCHKLGLMSADVRWRYGALFEGDEGTARLVLRYDKRSATLTAETPRQKEDDFLSLGFAASAVLHIARDFPGASWDSTVNCGMHEESTMYNLAASADREVWMGELLCALDFVLGSRGDAVIRRGVPLAWCGCTSRKLCGKRYPSRLNNVTQVLELLPCHLWSAMNSFCGQPY